MSPRVKSLPSLALCLVMSTAMAARAVEPLPPERQAVFTGSTEDPPAKQLLGVTAGELGKHYVAGNEWNLHQFYPRVRGLGGGYVGVGSDQAYLFIGWQKPELAWLIDYDPLIVEIQQLYQAFIIAAETPEAFRRLWIRKAEDEARAAIDARFPGEAERARMVELLGAFRGQVGHRLDRVKKGLVAAGVPSFLTDRKMYEWVRAFVVAGRARPMLGDLLADKGLVGIGEAARQLGVVIRVFYVSNAEQYWDYTPQYRANVAALPVDGRSLVLRTLLTWWRNQDYRYALQPMLNYRKWLEEPWVTKVAHIVPLRKDRGAYAVLPPFPGGWGPLLYLPAVALHCAWQQVGAIWYFGLANRFIELVETDGPPRKERDRDATERDEPDQR